MKFFIPLIIVIAAIALFMTYTDPKYQNAKVLAVQNASYGEALNKSTELHKIREGLLAKRNSFSDDNVMRLARMLPDNVDTIRLIIDINSIALRNGLALTNVSLGGALKTTGVSGQEASSGSQVGVVRVGFSVAASYPVFLTFLHDLEHSLRLLDVDKIDFNPDATGQNGTYQLDVRTYWLH
ncbi:MAG: hypothetical protein WCI89_03280 [bacterium]